MSDLGQTFTAKLGPAPAWVWGAGLASAYYGYRFYKARHGAPAALTAEQQAAADLQAAAPDLGTSAAPGGYTPGTLGGATLAVSNPGGQPYHDPSTASGSSAQTIVDNRDWQRQAVERLVGRFGYDPVSVSQALDAYLGGSPLTAQQEGIVDTAIRALGTPPEGAPPITRSGPSITGTPAKPNATTNTPFIQPVAAAKFPPPPSGPYTIAGPTLTAQETYWGTHYHYHFTPITNPGERIGNPGYWTPN